MSNLTDIAAGQDQVRAAMVWVHDGREHLALLASAWRALADQVTWQSPGASGFRACAAAAADSAQQAADRAQTYLDELRSSVWLVSGTGGCG